VTLRSHLEKNHTLYGCSLSSQWKAQGTNFNAWKCSCYTADISSHTQNNISKQWLGSWPEETLEWEHMVSLYWIPTVAWLPLTIVMWFWISPGQPISMVFNESTYSMLKQQPPQSPYQFQSQECNREAIELFTPYTNSKLDHVKCYSKCLVHC